MKIHGRVNRCSALHATPRACAIKSPPQPAAHQLRSDHKMARNYPLSLKYGQCLGHEEDPYSFSSPFLEDLHSGCKEYLANIQQLIDALPKSLDPASHFALRAQVTPTGHQRVMVAPAIRWGIPKSVERHSVLSSTPGTACGLARG